MKIPQGFEKSPGFAQNARGQQIRLCVKGPCFQAPVIAFAHDPLHVLMRDLKILKQRAFELVAAVGIFGNVPDPLQRQSDVTVVNRLSK